jgi:hypothetical protein
MKLPGAPVCMMHFITLTLNLKEQLDLFVILVSKLNHVPELRNLTMSGPGDDIDDTTLDILHIHMSHRKHLHLIDGTYAFSGCH